MSNNTPNPEIIFGNSFNNLNDLKAYIDSEIQNGIEKALSPLKDEISSLKSELKDAQATIIGQAELLAFTCKRAKVVECSVFEHDEEGDIILDSDEKPVLCLAITPEKPIEPKTPDLPTIETTLDMKAVEVTHYLQDNVKPNDFGQFLIGRKELTAFMTTLIDTELRVKKVSRQLKSDIFDRAVELFPNIVEIVVSKSGNKTEMLALKASYKSIATYAFAKTAPLGILA